jgi:hypothetical protein
LASRFSRLLHLQLLELQLLELQGRLLLLHRLHLLLHRLHLLLHWLHLLHDQLLRLLLLLHDAGLLLHHGLLLLLYHTNLLLADHPNLLLHDAGLLLLHDGRAQAWRSCNHDAALLRSRHLRHHLLLPCTHLQLHKSLLLASGWLHDHLLLGLHYRSATHRHAAHCAAGLHEGLLLRPNCHSSLLTKRHGGSHLLGLQHLPRHLHLHAILLLLLLLLLLLSPLGMLHQPRVP